ncbi:sodium--glutamate symport carrier GltS [Thermanaerovibrio velox DSM 12556]|uniref:Sodium/glutamate symporter n=1 Tax=Thermanaerovibrio velox DSM 12556 TaxID=926567 RepID=H0UPK7_9BACT|nr:sodium/glutamate symporter [Thermanaerovibrio velox]EHM09554.1 sodium--glutamate symport carrier GltS [Thermanaerovibrio velox DSM 12556]
MQLSFNPVETLAFACALLWVGFRLVERVGVLYRYNIPAPVVGGGLFSLANLLLRSAGVEITFDTVLKDYMMIAFFSTIGFGASVRLLKKGGPAVAVFLVVASVLVVLQDLVSWGLSIATGFNPILGLLAGSVTMSGGHGTGATFAAYFTEAYHVEGAMELAMAAATFGLVSGSLIGGPVARRLIERFSLKPRPEDQLEPIEPVTEELHDRMDQPTTTETMVVSIFQIALAMSVGALLLAFFKDHGIKMPTYLCALFVGIIIRNLADFTGLYKVNMPMIEQLGGVALYIFLAMALMSLQLWQLVGVAGPLLVILLGQVLLMILFAYFVTFNFNGRDYNAAVLAAGHCGFGLGATPNAIANMQAVTLKYGHAPRAFFTVSIVGAFFIDIVNSFVIQAFASMMAKGL